MCSHSNTHTHNTCSWVSVNSTQCLHVLVIGSLYKVTRIFPELPNFNFVMELFLLPQEFSDFSSLNMFPYVAKGTFKLRIFEIRKLPWILQVGRIEPRGSYYRKQATSLEWEKVMWWQRWREKRLCNNGSRCWSDIGPWARPHGCVEKLERQRADSP